MKPMRTQPYFNYAKDHLPTSSQLEQAVAEYLGMRLHKNPHLSPKEWEVCIDELVAGMKIDVKTGTVKSKYRVVGHKTDSSHLIGDLIYLFNVAASRGWNHVYFTPQQDAMWSNMSFYQDPYWSKWVKDPKTKKKLEEILDGKLN